MQLISTLNGELRMRPVRTLDARSGRITRFDQSLAALNDLLPEKGLSRGAVHEVLGEAGASSWFFAMLLAQTSVEATTRSGSPSATHRAVVCSDADGQLYPPALMARIPMTRLFLLHVPHREDELWALCQCLRCKGVGAVVASTGHLSRIEARRLQLAAEQGDGIGVLLRDTRAASTSRARRNARVDHYAAATRWLVQPAPGTDVAQRWSVQLVHGHGGNIGKTILLEVSRDIFDTDPVRAIDPVAYRSNPAEISKASA